MEKIGKIGIVFIIIGIIALAGTIFMVYRVSSNQETIDNNEKLDEQGVLTPTQQQQLEDDKDNLENQKKFRGICGILFIVFLIIGIALFMKGRE